MKVITMVSILKLIHKIPEQRHRIFAYTLISMGCFDFVSGLATIALGQKVLGLVFVALSLGFGLVFLPMMLMGKTTLSRVLVPYYAIGMLFIAASYYGPGVNTQLSIFIGAVYPFLVFSNKEVKWIFATLPAPLLFFASLEFTEYKALDSLFGGNFHLTEVNNFSKQAMPLASFFIVSTALFAFVRQVAKFQEQLETANNHLDMLIRTICHDIRNPLMVSMWHTEQLKRALNGLNDKQISTIFRANSQINSIIESVVEMQKLKTGKYEVMIENVRLSEVFSECMFTLNERTKAKNMALVIEQERDYVVCGNKSLLAQSVINNILTNAIKFSQSGSTIVVSTSLDGAGKVRVTIKDSGVGIPSTILCNLFNPSAPTTRRGTNNEIGTGFGLPIAKAYVEAMGGEISVQSKTAEDNPADHGTEFHITLKPAA